MIEIGRRFSMAQIIKTVIYAAVLLIAAGIFLPCTRAYAAADNSKYAYLYFFTIDGDEIEELEKKVSERKGYTFKNPDEYKYLPVDDGDETLYPELYYEVNGICWEEKDENGNAKKQYKEGDTFNWTSGDHYFYVKSDNPVLTGENIMDVSWDEQAHIYFCNVEGDEIYSLATHLSTKDTFTFPDPEHYAYIFESGDDIEEGEYIESDYYTGKGTHWYCKDDNDKEYLFEGGDSCKFRAGEYYFYAKTDDPVEVSFYYPIDVPTYFVTDHTPGQFYASVETKVGETIRLKKSLGAVLWGCTFQGWDELNRGDGEVYSGGESYKVMDNVDLDFFAVYEEDDDWDPDAVDENKTADELEEEQQETIIVDIDKINEAAGAGYGAYLDQNGVLRRSGGTIKINNDVNLYGIPGQIKKDKTLSPLKSGVDTKDPDSYNDPGNYKFDRYGNKIEDSKLPVEINNVLRQDDSALYMDVYGNAFVYYSDLSREANLQLVYERLCMGKTASWVNNTSSWDTEVVHRFEAIEFALIKGTYPEDGEVLVESVIGQTEDGQPVTEQVVWKDSYMSEAAYKKLLPFKKIWNGWMDTYDDGLYEKYKEESKDTTVGALNFNNLFGITAYADTKSQKNNMGDAEQIGSRVITSTDLEDTLLKPQYYVPTKTSIFGLFTFNTLEGLTAEQISNMTEIFNAIVSMGFTPEFAAGACGNIWQESHFNPTDTSGSYYGVVQWGGGRYTRLTQLANERGTEWSNLDTQIELIREEITGSYLGTMNRALAKYLNASNVDIKTITDVQTACDIWAYAVEGCVCSNDAHSEADCPRVNGSKIQELTKRRQYSYLIAAAMRSTGMLSIDENGYGVPSNASNNKVPYLPQSNAEWSSLPYGKGSGNNTIAGKGCSISSLAMVLSYHLGKWIYPSDVRAMIELTTGDYNAYMVKNSGASHDIFPAVAKMYGLTCRSISGAASIDAALKAGFPVIQSCDPGPCNFTKGGHFIVITGTDGNGGYYVNDPNSSHRNYSYNIYTLNQILNDGKGWWVLQ